MSTRSSNGSLEPPAPDRRESAAIQPFGFVLVASREWLIERASANLSDYFDGAPEPLIGQPLAALLGDEAVHSLRNQIALLRSPDAVARLFGCSAGPGQERFDFALQMVAGRAVIDGQRAGPIEHGDTIATVRTLIGRLEGSADIETLLDQAARHVRALTGFDRVALYRSEPGGTAALAARAVRGGAQMPQLLDSRATDSVIRRPSFIGDCAATDVPLEPPGPLKRSLLRAPFAGDLALLREAGAAAAITLPLRAGGSPWGVIVCEHPSPRLTSFERQSALGLYAQMLGMLIEIAELRAA